MRRSLAALGYTVRHVNEVFGNGTDRAARTFQTDKRPPFTGVAAGKAMTRLAL